MISAEQQARDMLERAGVDDAQDMTAGDLVEIATLIREVNEQAHLLGMSAEREAKLLAKTQQLEQDVARWRRERDGLGLKVGQQAEEIERLEESLAQRLEQIRQHNENCEADCNYRRADATVGKYCEAYTSRGQDCPGCPRQYILD